MIYAAYCKNEKVRKESSSGGIYYYLAYSIISKSGIVFACRYDGLDVVYEVIDDISKISETQGAKYSAPKLGDSFKKIRECLENNRNVLFIGVPCHCIGLQKYLCKEYPNLYIVSIVCHGVPSPMVLKRYCKEKDISLVNMRDKTNGWLEYNWKCIINNEEKLINHNQVSYMKGFISDFYLRPSCYECHFKNETGDIKIGDFWGVENIMPLMNDDKGTSIVLVNTEKGQKLFDSIKTYIIYDNIQGDEYKIYNGGFLKITKSKKREKFFKLLHKGEPFDFIIEKLLKVTIKQKIWNYISNLKRKIGNILLK